MLAAIVLLAVSACGGVAVYALRSLGNALNEDGTRPPVQYLDEDELSGPPSAPVKLDLPAIHHLAWTSGRWASNA